MVEGLERMMRQRSTVDMHSGVKHGYGMSTTWHAQVSCLFALCKSTISMLIFSHFLVEGDKSTMLSASHSQIIRPSSYRPLHCTHALLSGFR